MEKSGPTSVNVGSQQACGSGAWPDVYEVQAEADAEDQPLRLWPLRLGLGRRLLELNVGGQGLDGTDELMA